MQSFEVACFGIFEISLTKTSGFPKDEYLKSKM